MRDLSRKTWPGIQLFRFPRLAGQLMTLFCLLVVLFWLSACGDSTPTRPLSPPLSISGTITAAVLNTVDSDTNDPLSAFLSNDTLETAQALPNPVTLGGYLTLAATGVSGDRFASNPDWEDWYRVSLTAGQIVSLTIADHDGNEANPLNPDFDLYLVDPNDPLSFVQSSSGAGPQELISVLVTGSYYLLVKTFAGASNYQLSVSQLQTASLPAALRIEDEFIPNEIILRFRETTAAGSSSARSANAASPGLVRIAGQAGEPMLYRIQDASGSVQTRGVQFSVPNQTLSGRALQLAKRATIDQVKALRTRADVASADLNYIRRPLLVPNDTLYPSQWNLAMTNLPAAWDLTQGSADVVVAVVDSGVLAAHPDLAGRLCTPTEDCAGYDFVSDPTSGADSDGIDSDPEDPGVGVGQSVAFHGTQIAGILGAVGDNSIGVAGVDWTSRIMPVRVVGTLGGTSYDLIQGVRYAAGLSNDSGTTPLKIANIINLSLGGNGYSQVEQDLFNQVYAAGIFVFASAGNTTTNIPLYPATYSGVVSVSAVDFNKALAPYSNYGAAVDVAAPGGDLNTDLNSDLIPDGILSTSGDGLIPLDYNYIPDQGTSMAAPQVAGMAALMLAIDPLLLPTEFDAMLAGGLLTEDLGDDGPAVRNDSFGYGLIDVHKALLAAEDLAAGGSLPATLFLSPSRLNFPAATTSLPLTLSNGGGGTLTVTGSVASGGWIRVDTSAADTDGLGTYRVLIDRSGLTDGTYAETIRFTTVPSGSYTLNLLVQVGAGTVANTGVQTIRLLDSASGTVLQTLNLDADPLNGTYAYRFSDLSPGSFLISASSDLDHDGQSCDPGEACGGYPQSNAPSPIEITTSDLTGIDFSSGFNP